MNVKKIVIKGQSGYTTYDAAYNDMLVITHDEIKYECNPVAEDKSIIRKAKWRYKTISSEFAEAFKKISKVAEAYLDREWKYFITDMDSVKLIVTYEDGKRRIQDAIVSPSEYRELFELIKELIPPAESCPSVMDID